MAEAADNTPRLDDCWNRIGVWAGPGRDCPRLEEFVHCRNCPVYIQAGRAMLDQEILEEQDCPSADRPGLGRAASRAEEQERIMVLRLGEEWFGLPLGPVNEVLHPVAIHDLPHRADPALLGLANIKGNLTLVLDLAELLGVRPVDSGRSLEADHPIFPRLVLIGPRRQSLAFPVDEVLGIKRFEAAKLGHIPGTVGGRGMSLVSGLIHLEGRTIGVLNPETLIKMMEESIR